MSSIIIVANITYNNRNINTLIFIFEWMKERKNEQTKEWTKNEWMLLLILDWSSTNTLLQSCLKVPHINFMIFCAPPPWGRGSNLEHGQLHVWTEQNSTRNCQPLPSTRGRLQKFWFKCAKLLTSTIPVWIHPFLNVNLLASGLLR